MRILEDVGLADVQAVYSGPEGDLWELVMGQQIHIGGFAASMDLCAKAGIAQRGGNGVDLCCCNGAGMRFLLRFCGIEHMTGVDATPRVLERARARCADENMQDKTAFIQADVCQTGLPDASMDLVWGEDAWVYVKNKTALIQEVERLLKPGGTVAFTDWVEGPVALTATEAERFMRFMKFPSLAALGDYRELLQSEGLEVIHTENTGRYAPCMDLYLRMLNEQLTLDALRIIGYDLALMKTLGGEMQFIQELAAANKIIQGLYVARKA